jgi:hypothetical protein
MAWNMKELELEIPRRKTCQQLENSNFLNISLKNLISLIFS